MPNLKNGIPTIKIEGEKWEIDADYEILEGATRERAYFNQRFLRLLMKLDFTKVKPEQYNAKGLSKLFWEW